MKLLLGRGYQEGRCKRRSGDRLSLETSMFKNFATALVATAAAASLGVQAKAADITGAGATFPQPIYNKWGELYKGATQNSLNYQGIRLRRRHQADRSQDRGISARRQAAEAGRPRGQRPDAVPDRGRRRGAGNEPAGRRRGPGEAGRRSSWPRSSSVTSRPGATRRIASTQPRREAARPADHRRAPLGRLGHQLRVHHLPGSNHSPAWAQRVVARRRRENGRRALGGKGNDGVARLRKADDRSSIGYVEYAYAKQNKMTFAAMKNKAEAFVEPTAPAFAAAASKPSWSKAPGNYLLLLDQPGRSVPGRSPPPPSS